MISKDKVRKKAIETRDGLDDKMREANSKVIFDEVVATTMYQKADIILSYSSIRSEVETRELNEYILKQGKKLYLPKTYSKEKKMCFYPVEDLKHLHSGYQGILEPKEENPLEQILDVKNKSKEKILMIMPGLTFDKDGNRMGYGGGYYDRYLHLYGECLTSLLIAFAEQKALIIPVEKCDIRPDYIVTQDGIKKEE